MYIKTLLSLGLLANLGESASTKPKSFSLTARRVPGINLRRRASNSVSVTGSVVVDFEFGGETIACSVDTGSPFTWLASTLTPSSSTAGLPTVYDPTKDPTYNSESGVDPSGCGPWPSSVATCNYAASDMSVAGLTAKNMTIGISHTLGENVFANQAGSVGLDRNPGDPSTWTPEYTAFWYQVGADLADRYVFTADLYEDRNGTFDFGYVDTNKYTGEITYGSIDTSFGFWNFNMTGYTIGNGTQNTVSPFRVLFDSGGPNIGLPAEIVNPYFQSIGGSPSAGNSHTYPCSAYPPPDLTLQLQDGGKMVLNGSFLVEPPSSSGQTTCDGRLDDSVQTAYNLGQSVLDQKFVVFDHAKQRVGFADKRQDGQPTGVTPSAPTAAGTSTSTVTVTATGSPSSTQTAKAGGERAFDLRGGLSLVTCTFFGYFYLYGL